LKRGQAAAARRYARALLEVALAARDGNAAALRQELDGASALFLGQQELREALTSPAVVVEAKQKIVEKVWAGAAPLLRRLLGMLAQRNRLELLPDVSRTFAELWNASRGVLPAEAISAVPLTAEQQQEVAKALGRATGRDVELTAAVDPALLGGLLVRMAGQVYDGTVRGRLRALRERLTVAD
jgi:F-type H+-transporting ATPase subunit delta